QGIEGLAAVGRLARIDLERGEVPGQQLAVDEAVVDDERDGGAGVHPRNPASLNAASVAPQVSFARSASAPRLSARASRPASSIARQIAARRMAPRLALLDLSVCAGRTIAAGSPAAAAARMPSRLVAPSVTYASTSSMTNASSSPVAARRSARTP